MKCVSSAGRTGPWVGERRHFAEAVGASLRLPCGARSPRRVHQLGRGYEPPNSVRSTLLRGATSGCCTPQRFRGAQPLTGPRPCGTSSCLSRTATTVCSKAGADGCSGACTTLSIGTQRRESAACGGPARRIYAMARSAPVRSHRSRDAEREAEGTDAEGGGAASKLLRPSAPALPRHGTNARTR